MKVKGKITVRDIVLIGIWAALTFAAKLVLAPLANVELVSLLLAVFTVVMGLERGICAALVFTTLTVFESAYYGAGDWIVLYYINWPLLTILTKVFLKKESNETRAALLLGLFGLLFDIPSTGIKLVLFGPAYAIAYLISGIPFDAIHGAANFTSALFLYRPLVRQLEKARRRMDQSS
jgi:energy-coupling factor transport system substrate-specific component